MRAGLAGRIAQAFINSKLTPLLIAAFLAIGIYSTYLTPSEEEPQIDVPIADIFVRYPGAGAKEVESRVIQPLEKLISNIQGVEYLYSTSMPGQGMLIVRYYVGEDIERSLVKLYNEIQKNMDLMPYGVTPPLIKTRSIDDVPMLALTLWSTRYDDFDLRRVATELSLEIKKIDDVSETDVIGGRRRQVRVELSPPRMAAHGVDPLAIMSQIQQANRQAAVGSFSSGDREFLVETGSFFESAEEVANLVIGVFHGHPVYLRNVANVLDGPEEPREYVRFGTADGSELTGAYPAVTIAVSKRKGSDAKQIAEQVLHKTEQLRGTLLPSDINVTTTRNYGETASEKVSELMKHLFGAIIAVTLVVALSMGWRGGLVVFASVPITFALTLFVYYLFGYTLNRITLFALVFVTGIVVDDSIIIAENMHRHFKMRRLPFLQAAIASIDEVGNPTILATFTVIASVLPMAFVSGLMGPYMSPMPIGAALAMIFSLLVALIITPWLAYRLLKSEKPKNPEKAFVLEETLIYKFYSATIRPLIASPVKRWGFIGGVTLLLLGSMTLLVFKLVAVKMLPFDNKNELQVIIDMPEGTTLERTAVVAGEIAGYLKSQPEVINYQTYVGTAAPINFNGLVRHYDLRHGSNVADIQVNFASKDDRSDQSHDIAKRIRPEIQKIAALFNANVKIAEVPPGPPVLSTLVAEIYGPDYEKQIAVADKIKRIFEQNEGVVDVDWLVEDDQAEYNFTVDKEKAILAGVSTDQVLKTLQIALNGADASVLYRPEEIEAVTIRLRLPESGRSTLNDLTGLRVRSSAGILVPVSELVSIREQTQDRNIYRKNQRRVVYLTADVAGKLESPVYSILDLDDEIAKMVEAEGIRFSTLYTHQPFLEEDFAMKWDGEWHITYEVFRDLGAAFAVVLVIIYMLIIGWFQSFKVPLVMMVAIPLSLVGILVGHFLFDAFFTATSMIGMIALAGIMVRNSVLLIDFINLRLKDGVPLATAVVEAGAVRTTPILLTAGTVVIGAFVILFDPIFQGLAISLMGGSIASTALTLLIVPLVYYMTEKKNYPEKEKETAAPQTTTTGNGHPNTPETQTASLDETHPEE